jgi:hypothetical protein
MLHLQPEETIIGVAIIQSLKERIHGGGFESTRLVVIEIRSNHLQHVTGYN